MDYELDAYIKGKPFVVDANLQKDEMHIKTLSIKYAPKFADSNLQKVRSDPKYCTIKLAKEQEKAKSCPLYRKHGAKNFLLLDFQKSVDGKIIEATLSTGLLIQVDGKHDRYLFFGHTSTQLRQKTCVLYNESALKVSFEQLISGFGIFDMKNVSKRAARIGLLLSSSKVAVQLRENQIKFIDDIEHCGFNFTDGCGFISEEIAKEVVEKLQIGDYFKHQVPPYPSVYQIRIQGCKGVLILSKDRKWKDCIAIRKSMVKFKWNPNWKPRSFDLGIVSDGKGTSFPNRFGFLNRQYIRLLSGLGVKDEVFLKKQSDYFKDLSEIESNQEVQLRLLCAFEKYDLVDSLLRSSNGKTDEAIMAELYQLQQKYCSPFKGKTLSEGLRIPLEKSRAVYGVADPSEKLMEGQCFFQPTIRGKPTVLDTNVVVGRSPTYYPGDIRVLKCVHDEQLLHLVDCIVFPVQGRRPHANEMSGGDLDGDKFFVCWDEDLIPPRTEKPTSYEGSEGISRAKIGHEDLRKHFVDYNPHMLGKLDKLHWMWADASGVASQECKLIAKLFNEAVDSAKTGKHINIPAYLEKKPDLADPPFVWYTMHEKAVQWNLEHLEKKGKREKIETTELQYLQLEDMIALVSDTDCRLSEFRLFNIAFNWAECQGQVLLKQLLQHIDLQLMETHERDSVLSDLKALGLSANQSCIGMKLTSQDPDEEVKREVEEYLRKLFYTHKPNTALLSDLSVEGLSKLSLEGMNFLLKCKKQELSQFRLYQLCTIWCKTRKEDSLLELMRRIDFPRMSVSERKLALKELSLIDEFYNSLVTNALHQSLILNGKDIEKLKGKDQQEHERWVLYHRCEEAMEISWPLLNSILERDIAKLLVFKFVIGGENWVIAITIQQLSLQHCVRVNDTGGTSSAFISIHNYTNENRLVSLPHKYYIALDGERLQIFANNDRHQTFISLWNLDDGGKMGMSVALPTFDSSFAKSLGDRRLTREYVKCVEVFLNSPSPMTAPAVYDIHRQSTDVDEETTQPGLSSSHALPYSFRSSDFPLLGELPQPEVTEIEKQWNNIELKYYALKNKLEMGTSIEKELKEWLYSPRTNLESQEALRLEELLHHCSDLDSFDADDYATLLTILIHNATSAPNIQRLIDTMKRNSSCLTWKHFCRLIDHIVFACADRDFGISLLKYFRAQGNLQQNILNVVDFYSFGSCQYMIDWLPTITIEFLHRVKDCETLHSRKAKSVSGKISVDTTEIKGQIRRTVYVNVSGSHQPFNQDDGLILSWNKSKAIFYATIQDLIGMVWSVHIVWPDRGDELLEEQLKIDKDGDWQIEAFPNLVTHYRQIDALKTLCIRHFKEPKPSQLVQNITQLSTTDIESGDACSAADELAQSSCADEGWIVTEKKKTKQCSKNTPKQSKIEPEKQKETALDRSQRAAVTDAVTKKLTLIQGPPGTGKTIVAATIVKEWLKKLDDSSCKILVTAQSNEAVNNIYRKMMEEGIERDKVMRIGNPNKIPIEDRMYCFEEKYLEKVSANQKGFDYELSEKLLQCPKVICCTCAGAGSPILKSHRFKYVLIDEAAHAAEPVSLIPLALGAEIICLIGDEKQLRPFVKSAHAAELKQSLFERLKKCQKLPSHMLDIQYRMHPKLCDFPSQMFYNGKLQNGVQCDDRPLAQGISWKDPNLPVIFYNVTKAKEDYLSGPGSVFNELEAKKVLQVVKQLQKSSLSMKDIGIITPYKAQVELLSKKLKALSCESDVRTVDGFQGQERDIIIISTVRANSRKDRQIGFLDDPNRMNVLLTRAKRALIVIGNRDTLESNKLWKDWIEFMDRHKLIIDE